MARDYTQAGRFFGNLLLRGAGKWLEDGEWESKKDETIAVLPRTAVALGFDGSDNNDHTGLRAETLDTLHQFTPRWGVNQEPTLWNPTEHGGRVPRGDVMRAIRDVATQFQIVRAYFLAAEFGEGVFIKWPTYRIAPMHGALERFRTDITNTDSRFTHDGDAKVADHMSNAVMRSKEMDPLTKVRRYILGKPVGEDHRKIDYTMSSVLAHEAAMDSIKSGWAEADNTVLVFRR
jgi:phage terminase large subunit-like protein